jgi:hypothetical protein
MKNFLVSLPKPYNSNIVAREPISSIEGRRRSFFSFRWPASAIESVSLLDARRRASPASSLRSFGCGMGHSIACGCIQRRLSIRLPHIISAALLLGTHRKAATVR